MGSSVQASHGIILGPLSYILSKWMPVYFVKLLGRDITRFYVLLMLRYVNHQAVCKTDSFSFRDMHVI